MNEFINRNPDNFVFLVLTALVLSSLLGFYTVGKYHTQEMADKGYIEQALPGTTNTIWVKDNGRY